MEEAPVYILLATYNGLRYLAEQVESIQAQTCTDWRLLIRDDGSSDGTLEKLRTLARKEPRITLLEDSRGRLYPAQSFSALMEEAGKSEARTFAFCDQDDIWLPKKLERELNLLKRAESEWGEKMPFLVHTDACVVNEQGRLLHKSFLRYQNLRHEDKNPLPILLVQNFVTGCTTLFNRPLLELATPAPPQSPIHDWWLALCAAATGKLLFLPEATLLYRKHSQNAIGARSYWETLSLRQTSLREKWSTGTAHYRKSIEQAIQLYRRLREKNVADRPALSLIEEYAHHLERNRLTRLLRLLRLRVRREDPLRTLLLYLRIFFM